MSIETHTDDLRLTLVPEPKYPCTGAGFPVYVVNASTSEHVAAGINFARTHHIRLNVKGSGHDYLGRHVKVSVKSLSHHGLTYCNRSTAPNSLSIWTKHIRGIEFHDAFQPQGCHDCESVPAATLGAGEDWGQLYTAAHAHGRTFVGGTGDTIGLGGYLTGGGHSPLSAMQVFRRCNTAETFANHTQPLLGLDSLSTKF